MMPEYPRSVFVRPVSGVDFPASMPVQPPAVICGASGLASALGWSLGKIELLKEIGSPWYAAIRLLPCGPLTQPDIDQAFGLAFSGLTPYQAAEYFFVTYCPEETSRAVLAQGRKIFGNVALAAVTKTFEPASLFRVASNRGALLVPKLVASGHGPEVYAST